MFEGLCLLLNSRDTYLLFFEGLCLLLNSRDTYLLFFGLFV